MNFYFFNLMPYGALDLEFDKKYKSSSLFLPNSYYDPKIGHQLYNRYLDELEYADTLGYDGVCVNEHHQTAYGMMPTPGVTAGALSRSIKRGKVCVLGRALPLLSNPLTVAEEFAMLEQHHRRPLHRRLRPRYRRRVSRDRRQSGFFAGTFP